MDPRCRNNSIGWNKLDSIPFAKNEATVFATRRLVLVERSSGVAGKKDGGDCQNYGSGSLYTGEPIIIDVLPMNKTTLYNGDCTRTVVNGEIVSIYQKTSEAVRAAKAAATATIKADVDGETVHKATIKALEEHGFGYAAPEPPRRKTRFVAPAARRAGSGSRSASPP